MSRLFLIKISNCEDKTIAEIKNDIANEGLGYHSYPEILSELKTEDND